MPHVRSPVALIVLMCLCEVLTTLDAFAFASLLPQFRTLWDLSATELGWISGIFYAGYTLAVPVLVTLTDRIDARPIYMSGAAIIALSSFGFALFADGFWTALVFRFFAGVGFAGAYMPGLRVLIDRYDGPNQPRAIACYTAFFSLGVANSYLIAGTLSDLFGWQAVFWATGGAAAAAVVIVLALLRGKKPPPPATTVSVFDFRPILSNRAVMGYVLGYAVHAWELLGLRAWIVGFLAFSAGVAGGSVSISPTIAAAFGAVLAIFASIAGGELATRYGRRRVVSLIMLISAVGGCSVGFAGTLSYGWVIFLTMAYIVLVQGESAALTTGTVQAAPPGRQGATLAVHSIFGFTGGFFGPLVFGIALDGFGGVESGAAWGAAFATLGLAVVTGPVFLLLTRPRR
ncbi:MAG: MFS transporter [Rhodospirillaceae bacterium]|nr:MFS transporter [Rhodospirillaceae bacterium]